MIRLVVVTTITDKIKFIQSVFGQGKLSRATKNIDVWCPVCAPGDKSKKKLSIRLDDDANHCWTCEWKSRSLVSLIKKYGTRDELVEYRDKFMTGHARDKIDVDEDVQMKVKLPDDFELLTLASDGNPDVKAALRYIEGRGLTEKDLWYFKIGVSDEPRWRRRIIVPSFDVNGTLNYYVARAVDMQRKPKYDNPDNDKTTIIFNEINIDWSREITLCEGSFDMFKCGDNAIPLLGSSLNEQSVLFNSIIAHNTPVALALDADMLLTRVPKIAEKLAEYDVTVRVVDVSPFDDPGKMTREQFKEKHAQARPYTWLDTFQSKLSRATQTSLSL